LKDECKEKYFGRVATTRKVPTQLEGEVGEREWESKNLAELRAEN